MGCLRGCWRGGFWGGDDDGRRWGKGGEEGGRAKSEGEGGVGRGKKRSVCSIGACSFLGEGFFGLSFS